MLRSRAGNAQSGIAAAPTRVLTGPGATVGRKRDAADPSDGSADRRRGYRRRRQAAGPGGLEQIYQAWLDRNVMVVRDQDLTIPDFIPIASASGR